MFRCRDGSFQSAEDGKAAVNSTIGTNCIDKLQTATRPDRTPLSIGKEKYKALFRLAYQRNLVQGEAGHQT